MRRARPGQAEVRTTRTSPAVATLPASRDKGSRASSRVDVRSKRRVLLDIRVALPSLHTSRIVVLIRAEDDVLRTTAPEVLRNSAASARSVGLRACHTAHLFIDHIPSSQRSCFSCPDRAHLVYSMRVEVCFGQPTFGYETMTPLHALQAQRCPRGFVWRGLLPQNAATRC